MANKRKANTQMTFHKNKRHQPSDDGDDDGTDPTESQAHVNPTYGQRAAFPGLDDENDDTGGLFYGPASDGLEYLRMVRSEAKGVPNLLIAPKDQAIESDEVYDNSRDGYYADGAYIANISPMVPQDAEDSEIDPQDAYYAALLERFQDAASQLRKPSTTPTLDALTIDLLKILASASYKTWRSTILTETPRPTLLYGLPQEAILKGLAVLGSLFNGTKKEDHERWRRLGAWVWALLARCRDVSEMSSEEVSTCRELGKKAAWILRVGQAGVQDEPDINLAQTEEEACEEGENPAPTDILHEHPDLEPDLTSDAKQGSKAAVATRSPLALSHSVGSTSVDILYQNTMSVTLDMIVTLVGEKHGQRDLLDARLVWGEENS